MTVTVNIKRANKVNGDWGLFLSFPYNTEIVNVVRGLPTRYWYQDTKEWEVPFNKLEYLIDALNKFEINIISDSVKPFQPKEIAPKVDYNFKTNPFPHQIDGFNYGMEHTRWLLGDEQGLGKTKQVIDIAVAKKHQNNYPHCLIVCGVNGLKWNWQNEIATHSDETGWILGQKRTARGLKIGSSADKLADLNRLSEIPSYFLITNVESFRDDEIVKKVAELCKKKIIGLIAFDECHKCFDYSTEVITDNGVFTIGDIVTKHLEVNALSLNEDTNSLEWKPVTGWFANTVLTNLVELTIETTHGIKTIKCTRDHKFCTSNRGWVSAEDLTDSDDIIEVDNLSFM